MRYNIKVQYSKYKFPAQQMWVRLHQEDIYFLAQQIWGVELGEILSPPLPPQKIYIWQKNEDLGKSLFVNSSQYYQTIIFIHLFYCNHI